MFRSAHCWDLKQRVMVYILTVVLEHSIGPIFQGHVNKSEFFLDCLTHDDGTDRLSRNIGKKIRTTLTQNPKILPVSFTPQPKLEIEQLLMIN
jgi:hypothetical protein